MKHDKFLVLHCHPLHQFFGHNAVNTAQNMFHFHIAEVHSSLTSDHGEHPSFTV